MSVKTRLLNELISFLYDGAGVIRVPEEESTTDPGVETLSQYAFPASIESDGWYEPL